MGEMEVPRAYRGTNRCREYLERFKGKIYLGVDDFVEEMRGKLDGGDEDMNIPRVQQTSTGIQTEHILRQYKIRMTQYGRRTTLELTVTADCSEFGVHFITSGTIVRETVCSQ
jgi:hypothetical protein